METQQILGNRYELRRRVAVGGMATVFLAHDSMLDRDVAVKVLDMAGVTDHTFVERFRREARAAAAINHPHVISIYDWGQTTDPADGTAYLYYLVMEYVPGPNLKEKIQRDGPLPADEALRVASQVASALEAAHARGLIHRDIKSQNVLLDTSGNAKVADFGIAYLEGLTHLTQTNAVSGTAHYISPEQAQGKRVDARTDIYSLGVVLYEMLTGRVPFEGESLIDVALHHVQDQPIPVTRLQPDISAPTEAIVARALAKDPAERFAGAAEMRAALDSARAALTVQPTPTQQSPPPDIVVERVPRSTARTQVSPLPTDRTAKLGTGTPGRRPRLRQEEKRSRWWLWAVPVVLLALVGGVLAMRSLAGNKTASPPGASSSGHHPSARPTARAGAPAATSTSHHGAGQNGVPPSTSTARGSNGAPVAAVPRKTPTSPPPSTVRPTAPPPTKVPIAAATPLPTTPPPPAAVPPAAITRPTAVSTPAPSSSGAASPDGAVLSFYSLVSHHQFASAATLWSSNMKANYPPSTNIYGRFDNTQQMSVRITGVTQSGNTATVGVALVEQATNGTVSGYTGSWYLVRGSSGWLLDSVSLSPTQVSAGAGPPKDGPPGHGKHKGNEGDQGSG
jgi:serine/threonine protein kinase